MPRIGIYPGTFDPPTRGHLDIIARAAKLVDKLIVGVAVHTGKGPLFTLEERVALVKAELKAIPNAEAKPLDGLLIEFAKGQGAQVIFRGLRAISDFEYEFQMAGMNRNLHPQIETVFLMSSAEHQFVSSRFVKEIARLHGDVTPFLSKPTLAALKDKFANGHEPAIEPRLVGT